MVWISIYKLRSIVSFNVIDLEQLVYLSVQILRAFSFGLYVDLLEELADLKKKGSIQLVYESLSKTSSQR